MTRFASHSAACVGFSPLTRRVVVAHLAALATSSACATIRSATAVPIPMHLTAKTEFLLHQSAGADRAVASQCALMSADIEVDSVRADTLFVRRLLRVRQERGVTPCRGEGAGIVVASENPSLRAQTGRGSLGGTIVAGVIGSVFFAFSAVVLAFALAST